MKLKRLGADTEVVYTLDGNEHSAIVRHGMTIEVDATTGDAWLARKPLSWEVDLDELPGDIPRLQV